MEALIEKELILNLEKSNNANNNSNRIYINSLPENIDIYKLPSSYSTDIISDEKTKNEDNTKLHYDKTNEDTIKKVIKTKEKKFKMFTQYFGDYYYKTKQYPFSPLNRQCYISSKLYDNTEMKEMLHYNNEYIIHDNNNFLPLFFKYLDNYRDIQINAGDYEKRHDMMKVYLFHILNHILKRKEEIEVNNNIYNVVNDESMNTTEAITKELFRSHDAEFIAKYHKEHSSSQVNNNDEFIKYQMNIKSKYSTKDNDTVNIKDQGFTCPKILILVPNKKHAKTLIEELIQLYSNGSWKGISHKSKFKEDFQEFSSNDDHFRLGLKFSFFDNKLDLYTSFDESDIIIASPLGLKLASPTSDSNSNSGSDNFKNKKIYDFLSSIEILLVDFSEMFIYQNIEHLNEILTFLNKPPKNNQNIINIDRIKETYINNYSIHLRQSIFVSEFKTLDIDILFNEHCNNINGKVIFDEMYVNQVDKIKNDLSEKYSSLHKSKEYEIRFEFKMLFGLKGENDYDDKFNYFTKNVWHNLYESFDKHTIIFIASTFDYYRVKSFFKQTSKSVCFIFEDSDKKDWQRYRKYFEDGKYKFMLFSERGYVYRKINLKFAKNIFFYSLPEDPKIFYDMIQLIDPIRYKESLRKYNLDKTTSNTNKDKINGIEVQAFGSVIALVSPIEKYVLEKTLGKLGSNIMKDKTEYYSCS